MSGAALVQRVPAAERTKLAAMAVGAELVFLVASVLPVVPVIGFSLVFYGPKFALVAGIGLTLLIYWLVQPSLDRPEGREVTREQAPALFDALDKLSEKAAAPRIGSVILDDELNAAAYQSGGFMSLTGSDRVLILGTPLLRLLTPEEAKSVIAHELGHFSRNHGRLGHWIYIVRAKWSAWLHEDPSDSPIDRGLHAMAEWFVPGFVRRSAAWSRQCEFEADAIAAQCTSPRALVDSLARFEAASHAFGKGIARELNALRRASPEAPRDYWDLVARHLTREAREVAGPSRSPGAGDTHPPLAERAAALGLQVHDPGPVTLCAGEALLGHAWNAQLSACNEAWHAAAAASWQFDHLHQRWIEHGGMRELVSPRTAAEEALGAAALRDVIDHDAASLEQLQAAAAALPESPMAAWFLGLARLQRQDRRGIDSLRAAVRLDRRFSEAASSAIIGFLRQHGPEHELEEARVRRRKTAVRLQPVDEALWGTLLRAPLAALPESVRPLLAEALSALPPVDGAWGVRVELPDAEGRQHTVNALVVRVDLVKAVEHLIDEEQIARRACGYVLAATPAFHLARVHTVYASEPLNPRLQEQLEKVPGSLLVAPRTALVADMIKFDQA